MSLSVLIAFIPTLTNNGIVQKKSEYLIQKLVTFESIQKHILYPDPDAAGQVPEHRPGGVPGVQPGAPTGLRLPQPSGGHADRRECAHGSFLRQSGLLASGSSVARLLHGLPGYRTHDRRFEVPQEDRQELHTIQFPEGRGKGRGHGEVEEGVGQVGCKDCGREGTGFGG